MWRTNRQRNGHLLIKHCFIACFRFIIQESSLSLSSCDHRSVRWKSLYNKNKIQRCPRGRSTNGGEKCFSASFYWKNIRSCWRSNCLAASLKNNNSRERKKRNCSEVKLSSREESTFFLFLQLCRREIKTGKLKILTYCLAERKKSWKIINSEPISHLKISHMWAHSLSLVCNFTIITHNPKKRSDKKVHREKKSYTIYIQAMMKFI